MILTPQSRCGLPPVSLIHEHTKRDQELVSQTVDKSPALLLPIGKSKESSGRKETRPPL